MRFGTAARLVLVWRLSRSLAIATARAFREVSSIQSTCWSTVSNLGCCAVGLSKSTAGNRNVNGSEWRKVIAPHVVSLITSDTKNSRLPLRLRRGTPEPTEPRERKMRACFRGMLRSRTLSMLCFLVASTELECRRAISVSCNVCSDASLSFNSQWLHPENCLFPHCVCFFFF